MLVSVKPHHRSCLTTLTAIKSVDDSNDSSQATARIDCQIFIHMGRMVANSSSDAQSLSCRLQGRDAIIVDLLPKLIVITNISQRFRRRQTATQLQYTVDGSVRELPSLSDLSSESFQSFSPKSTVKPQQFKTYHCLINHGKLL